MQIWVDADACPAVIKDILFRVAERVPVSLALVANHPLRIPTSTFIRTIQVPKGFDMADGEIARQVQPEDLVVTADIPLAAEVVERGACALNHRGELYTRNNIGEHLGARNFVMQLRDSGITVDGPAAMTHGDRKAFAAQLDRYLSTRAP